MKLYHGSKFKIDRLERRQATQGQADVPQDELLDAIYLTPDYGFAVAMAARPDNSGTEINDAEHKITFEKPELFNPEQDIHIYSIESEKIPNQYLKHVDDLQYAIVGVDHVSFSNDEVIKARKLLDYYKLTNWKENKEISNEFNTPFKMR